MMKKRVRMDKKSTLKYKSITKEKKEERVCTRREFLKKSVYATPTLLILGQLMKPSNAQADGAGSVPSTPIW